MRNPRDMNKTFCKYTLTSPAAWKRWCWWGCLVNSLNLSSFTRKTGRRPVPTSLRGCELSSERFAPRARLAQCKGSGLQFLFRERNPQLRPQQGRWREAWPSGGSTGACEHRPWGTHVCQCHPCDGGTHVCQCHPCDCGGHTGQSSVIQVTVGHACVIPVSPM